MPSKTTQKANELPDNAINIETSDIEENRETQVSDESDKEAENKAERLRNIRERYDHLSSYWGRIHTPAREDDEFISGKHWPENIKREREDEGRPCLTYNLLPAYVKQIVNKIRQERPRPKAVPVQGVKNITKPARIKNLAGSKDYSQAEVLNGIIKNIEHLSRADQAYDTAVKHSADHGFGFFYLVSEEDVRDPFVQTLKIYRVKDSFTVLLDDSAQEADFSDGQDGMIFTRISKSAFKAKYKNAVPIDFDSACTTYSSTWFSKDEVMILQYFYVDYIDDEVVRMSNGMTVYYSKIKDVLDELKEDTGIHIVKKSDGEEMRKAVKRPVCKWLKCTAHDILEEAELPFTKVPIFIVTGEELVIDGETIYESAIRHAKDPSRSYNYWRTAAAETVALAPKSPFILTAAQIKGHERDWKKANSSNVPYLKYNHKDGVSAPQRQSPTNVAAAELSNATQDANDIQSIIGIHDATLGADGNEKSGKAIIARQNQGNTATYQFPDNLTRAISQCTRLMIEGILQIYDSERVERIRLPDDTEDFVALNTTIIDEQKNKPVIIHDLGMLMYDVVMETGPSYATQRQEAAQLQMDLLKILGPERASNIVHLIIKNLGVSGSEDVYEILRKMLPDALKTQEEREADLPAGITFDEHGQAVDEQGNPWQPPPTIEQQIQMKQQEIDEAQAAADKAKAEADIAGADADKAQAQAKIEEAKAKQARAAQEMKSLELSANGDPNAAGVDMKQIESIIRSALEEHGNNPKAHAAATEEAVQTAMIAALKRTKIYVDKAISTQQGVQS